MSDPLELELQEVVNHLMWVLGPHSVLCKNQCELLRTVFLNIHFTFEKLVLNFRNSLKGQVPPKTAFNYSNKQGANSEFSKNGRKLSYFASPPHFIPNLA